MQVIGVNHILVSSP